MPSEGHNADERRPLASRELPLFKHLARVLAHHHVSPNLLSVLSVGFASAGALALVFTSTTEGIAQHAWWLTAAVCVQLRLLMNMLDGMVAIESGRVSALGELYNEIPDRLSDPIILAACGYAWGGDATLGLTAALGAMFVAYIRAMGKSSGAGQVFMGPMAKPQRMFMVTALCLFSGLTPMEWQRGIAHPNMGPASIVLVTISIGCAITAIRRLHRIAITLKGNSNAS